MKTVLKYTCISNIGKKRRINQDNYICDGDYMQIGSKESVIPVRCVPLKARRRCLLGVFDGMGGEECGEIASLIAAECAVKRQAGKDMKADLLELCRISNEAICDYADKNGIGTMGTTAAILDFSKNRIEMCNIGDSKVFRLSDGGLTQISVDHYSIAPYGQKPPLSQNLGISPMEMVIEPYICTVQYKKGDIFLICSDGLTDMVDNETIKMILKTQPIESASKSLLSEALDNGGKDNITIILSVVEKKLWD